jgi:hypothetical protein
MLLHEGVESYKKEGPKFMQRLGRPSYLGDDKVALLQLTRHMTSQYNE